MSAILFKRGDKVRATKCIQRVDGRCSLGTGQVATIESAEKSTISESWIVSVKLENGDRMISIVVTDGIPLVKV